MLVSAMIDGLVQVAARRYYGMPGISIQETSGLGCSVGASDSDECIELVSSEHACKPSRHLYTVRYFFTCVCVAC
jgi:hypothetical protein